MMTDDLFITPHAIEQFQKRIARLGDEQAREVIRARVSQAANVSVLPDGETLRVRTVKPFPYEFRAYCVFDHERGHRVVTTIVWGDSRAKRKRRALARSNAVATSVASEFGPVFQRRDNSGFQRQRREM